MCEEVEADVGTWLELALEELAEPARGNAIERLQRLDTVTQTLRDFALLVESLSKYAQGEIPRATLMHGAKLEKTTRLVAKKICARPGTKAPRDGDLQLF